MDRRLGADAGLAARMFLTMFLLAALYLGFIAVLIQAGADLFTIILFAGLMLGLQYYYSDRLVLWSMGARLVDEREAPELHAMINRLVALADLPKPRVAVVHTPMPNAFATGRSPQHSVVAVTTGLLERLNRAEIEAVLAHELTHIKNRDSMVLTLASFFATVASLILRWGRFGLYGGYGYGRRRDRDDGMSAIVLIYLASLVVWILSFFLIRALSRYREYAADRGAAIITGAPANLASALMKISGVMQRIPDRDLREVEALNAFFIIPALKGSAIAELFSTHPSLENRIRHLQRIEQELRR